MKTIEISQDSGNAYGYISSIDDINFLKYLDDHLDSEIKNKLLSKLSEDFGNRSLTLLLHIFVNKEFRSKGVGQELFQKFQDQSSGIILLICDNLEIQNSGFSLEQWYKRLGFKETGFVTLSGPILIKES